tara:strand:+ start:496 stop:738 length:243 start_codon:yes stop_codon:yes gene_type:complete
MNKDYLDSLNKDQLEIRIYDLENELRQEWYQEKIMKFRTARKLEGEVAYCKALLENFKPVENQSDRFYRHMKNINGESNE